MANLSNKLSSRSLWETSSRLVRLALRLLAVERVRDEKSIEEGRSTLERVLAPNRCFLPFPSLCSFSFPLLTPPLESLPHPDSVPGTRRSRSTYAATPGLERSRASSSAPPFTPRCSLENPTLFGSFDQSPPANYGLVMYRLLLGPPFFYVASRGPLLFFPFSSLFFCFFFLFLFLLLDRMYVVALAVRLEILAPFTSAFFVFLLSRRFNVSLHADVPLW